MYKKHIQDSDKEVTKRFSDVSILIYLNINQIILKFVKGH